MATVIQKLLIANRGEIACRILRTARRLGMATVAVYSDADATALHVRQADEAVRLGPAPARESYLDSARVIAAAIATGADAIHPGYGFLSENADFAEACVAAGLRFVGPPASAIRAMGGKSAAKALMEAAGVPVVPGYHGPDQTFATLHAAADAIGYPVLLKASAGGGGKGMRVVAQREAFAAALASCQREAAASFGDEQVLVEKYLERPRHIEIQVFADQQGNCIHLHERDCSVQRRHQKVLEEAPAPGMTPERREAMGAAATRAAAAVGYVGAGTVEFIVSPAGDFYFMEMNTRLQVEHPVTEMITGLDLVEWQLRVAVGESLPMTQSQVPLRGHAIEARLYAEAPFKGFLPSTGKLVHLQFPATSGAVRVDTGVADGDTITPYYDPMIAKLVVHGADRADALEKLQQALAACEIAGPENNVTFLRRVVACEDFAAGRLDTGLIERNRDELLAVPKMTPEVLGWLATAEYAAETQRARARAMQTKEPASPWAAVDGWRSALPAMRTYVFRNEAERHTFRGEPTKALPPSVTVVSDAARRYVFHPGEMLTLERVDVLAETLLAATNAASGGHAGLRAPMPGRVVAQLVTTGAKVAVGAPLLVLEAMKMEHTLTAPKAGTVVSFRYAAGAQVQDGDELVEFVAD
jgi:3-methylcrotonyl-CoA carboxylase alpha subunit